MNEFTQRYWQWGLLGLIVAPVVVLWLQRFGLSLDGVGALQVFPYLGILAWGVMWTHYAGGLLRKNFDLKPSHIYSVFSHYSVTALILLHPGLLAYGQYESTGTKPLQSYWNYVGTSAKAAVTAGLIALLTFLSYDVYRKLQSKDFWKRQQWIVSLMQSTAMTLIFWHGLRIGQHLQSGWFRYWWIVLGVVLLAGQYSDIKRAFDQRFPAGSTSV